MTFRHAGRRALLARMRSIVRAHSEQTAVRSSAARVSYGDFSRLIGWLCQELRTPPRAGRDPIGLMLDRSATAYAAMWAAIALGRPYVPLNARYPHSRLRSIIRQAGLRVIICTESDRDMAGRLGIISECVVAADSVIPPAAPGAAPDDWSEADEGGRIAYILFTSGSTGEPKGVPISYENLCRFIENLDAVIDYRSDDVCSQVCELSFDFSVHEIYLALLNGGALCPARQIDLFNPARYVTEHGITVWTSVPSLARVVLHNGLLGEGGLGTLRLSMFNGEALTGQLARDWSAAAHRTEIWNTYGPTECTVAVTTQRWQDVPELCEAGVVSIGTAFSDCTTALLIGEEIVPVASGTNGCAGELLLATPQCFDGYLDPGVSSPFIRDGTERRYYRTGDRVLVKDNRLYFLDRLDHQVKIGGHRIELLEVEHRLRRYLGSDALAVIAHPRRHPTRLVLFVAGGQAVPDLTAEGLGLPGYMVPRRSILVDSLPVTAHGKLDRDALHEYIEEGS